MSEQQDKRVVQECLKGDIKAFEQLVEKYQKQVYNTALRISNDIADAEDITQNVFIKVYENLDKYNSRYAFFSWIYRIAMNESINYNKQKKYFTPLQENLVDINAAPDKQFEISENNSIINNALSGLTLDHRAVIVLRHFVGFSYNELSYILEIPEKTVKSRLFSARHALKDVLNNKGLVDHNAS